jgi:TonB family protein
MDRKPSNPESDSWVDHRMASLDPAPGWNPEAGRALERLTQPVTPPSSWMRLGMTATILATTVFVLVLLPWQKLWTPEPATTPKTTVAALQDPAPPPAPAPAPQQTEAVKPSEQAAPETRAQNRKTADKMQAAPAPQARPSVVTGPKVVSQVLPEYTEEARQAKVTGQVDLIVTIRTDGSAQIEKVRNGLGYGLDEKAREAVEKWIFTPGQKDGVPVTTMIEITVTFSLR